MSELNEITTKEFVTMFKEASDGGQRFCFILGAGASRESGIKTGIEMAQEWHNYLAETFTPAELAEKMARLRINAKGGKMLAAKSENYFSLYDLRFHTNPKNGYAYIERAMEHAHPSYGYFPLAMLLTQTRSNLVITTNFDSLTEDALFIYTDTRPLVISHELLADHLDFGSSRPIVAKIHRGLFFKPMSRQGELRELSAQWAKVLRMALNIYTPVVIGYAGGDNSLMKLLKEESIQPQGFYWCYHKDSKLSSGIKKLVEGKGGHFVPIEGFDALMFSLAQQYSFAHPYDHIDDSSKRHKELYQEKYDAFFKKTTAVSRPDDSEQQLLDDLEAAEKGRLGDLLTKVATSSDDAMAHFELSGIYYNFNQFEAAIEALTESLALDPDYAPAYHNRGCAFSRLGDYTSALRDFTRAIELKPDDARSLFNRGTAYSELAEYQQAIEDFTRAINIEPGYARAYYNRGVAHRKLNHYARAIADYTRAIELMPDDASAYVNRGAAYQSLDDYDRAIEDYTRATRLDQSDALAYYNRGEARMLAAEARQGATLALDLGLVELAVKDFTAAIKLDPAVSAAYWLRAKAYDTLGEPEKAVRDRKRAKALGYIEPETAATTA